MTSEEDLALRFGGVRRLYGAEGFAGIQAANVIVVGVGGVGSWVAEALARSGVGRIRLADLDDVCVTNVNRQLHALSSTVGQPKVSVLAERLADIHPGLEVDARAEFFGEDTAEALLAGEWSWVVDAIDDVQEKCRLLDMCHRRGIPVVTCGGAGGRRNPASVRVGTLGQSSHDGLLRAVRRQLRARYGWESDAPGWSLPCVFSMERARAPQTDFDEDAPLGRLDCASGIGTACPVTGTFGFVAASVVLAGLASDEGAPDA